MERGRRTGSQRRAAHGAPQTKVDGVTQAGKVGGGLPGLVAQASKRQQEATRGLSVRSYRTGGPGAAGCGSSTFVGVGGMYVCGVGRRAQREQHAVALVAPLTSAALKVPPFLPCLHTCPMFLRFPYPHPPLSSQHGALINAPHVPPALVEGWEPTLPPTPTRLVHNHRQPPRSSGRVQVFLHT